MLDTSILQRTSILSSISSRLETTYVDIEHIFCESCPDAAYRSLRPHLSLCGLMVCFTYKPIRRSRCTELSIEYRWTRFRLQYRSLPGKIDQAALIYISSNTYIITQGTRPVQYHRRIGAARQPLLVDRILQLHFPVPAIRCRILLPRKGRRKYVQSPT